MEEWNIIVESIKIEAVWSKEIEKINLYTNRASSYQGKSKWNSPIEITQQIETNTIAEVKSIWIKHTVDSTAYHKTRLSIVVVPERTVERGLVELIMRDRDIEEEVWYFGAGVAQQEEGDRE